MKRFLLALVAALTLASPAQAWWEFGHATVAGIAWANVTPRTRGAIRRILADSALLGTPECPVRTIADASGWADCIKKIKSPDGKATYADTFSWHYQDVGICRPFDLTAACKDGNCVSAQIERDVALLKDPATSRAERVRALVFLIHFVGDLAQPLHAGEKDDQGGNKVLADYDTYRPPKLNLHSIWDGYLAERAITTGPDLVRAYSKAEKARVQVGSVADWSRESWQVARDSVYRTAMKADPCLPTPARVTLDEATIEQLVPVVRLQIERGGLRLAKLLDEALG